MEFGGGALRQKTEGPGGCEELLPSNHLGLPVAASLCGIVARLHWRWNDSVVRDL